MQAMINASNVYMNCEQEKAICKVLSNDCKTAHLIATWQYIQVLESINKALAPLASLTDIMSGKDYVTVSTVKPCTAASHYHKSLGCGK